MAEKAFVCSNHFFIIEVSLNAMSLSHSEPRQVTNEAEELREMTLNDILTLSLRSLSSFKKEEENGALQMASPDKAGQEMRRKFMKLMLKRL